jgi:hypothetical protein
MPKIITLMGFVKSIHGVYIRKADLRSRSNSEMTDFVVFCFE